MWKCILALVLLPTLAFADTTWRLPFRNNIAYCSTEPANYTEDHNYYYVSSASQDYFSCLGPATAGGACTHRSFADHKTYVSDTTSSINNPDFVNVGSGDFTLNTGSSAKTAGRLSGYIGAIEPEGSSSSSSSSSSGGRKNWMPFLGSGKVFLVIGVDGK
jgi:hypothetical protein